MDEDQLQIAHDPAYMRLVGPVLSSVPIVGGPISALWTEWDSVRKTANIQSVLDKLREILETRIDELERTTLNIEDMQLLDNMLQRARRENSEDKRNRFAQSLASAWTTQHSLPFEERMLFQKANSEFHDEHIKALEYLVQAGPQAGVPYAELRDKILGHIDSKVEQESILIPILDSLATKYGLIKISWVLNDPKYNPAPLRSSGMSPEGIARTCNHAIKPLGLRYFESITG